MIDAIDHVVLTCRNLENTINFYCKVLGMKSKKEFIKDKQEYIPLLEQTLEEWYETCK